MQKNYALVTGASSGLGTDFAELLAQKGYHLVLVARRRDRMEELAQKLKTAYGVDVRVYAMDLATPEAPQMLFDQVKADGLTVDVLINNAGYGLFGNFVALEWRREAMMLQLDMICLTHLTKLFSREMVARGKGYILLISSIGAYQATPTYATYAAAKSYVLHFGEAVHHELRGTGVHVSVLSPGITATEFLKVSGQKATFYQRMAMMQSRPVARVGLNAMFRNKASVVPGLMNKIAAWSIRLVPRVLATAMAEILMRDNSTKATAAIT